MISRLTQSASPFWDTVLAHARGSLRRAKPPHVNQKINPAHPSESRYFNLTRDEAWWPSHTDVPMLTNCMKLEKRLVELREIWPSLEWCSARLLEHDHDIVILDETLVFRFQCENPLHEPLEPEIKFLKAVRRSVEVALPNYTHVDTRYRVAGYPKLPGEPLTLSVFASLTNRQKKCLAQSLGEFLKTIHRFSTHVASSFGIREMQPLDEQMTQALHYYRQLVAWDSLTRNERSWCERTTASTIDSLSKTNSSLSQVVVRDLSIEHLLIADGKLGGIIDFGDIALGTGKK